MNRELKTEPADGLNPTGNPKPSESTSDEVVSEVNLFAQKRRLYFKGLVSEKKTNGETTELLTGYGVAICNHNDKLLFQMKGSFQETEITSFEAEVMTLKLGLTEAQSSGIKHILIYTECYPLYVFLSGLVTPDPKFAVLVNDVQRMREQFESTKVYPVTGSEIKFAYELANEAMVSQISRPTTPPPCTQKAATKTFCCICVGQINVDQMFYITGCTHSYCRECMKQQILARLSEGLVLNCPHYNCNTMLTLESCESLLTPNLRTMWELRLIENNLPPMEERVYCPYPKCSALMSKTDISEAGVKRSCIKCGEPFCIDCKVPWHNDLLCNDYKLLHLKSADGKLEALANKKKWRQCDKCGHMIERYRGCSHMTCRCGHRFCYKSGTEVGLFYGNGRKRKR